MPGAGRDDNSVGLHTLDHLTHNVNRGRMDHWAEFYERIFNFRQIRYFDIEGQQTALLSRAMTAPDDKIRIPLNESQDDYSQIAEYLKEYKGEGIQHLAFATDDIFATVDRLRANGVTFQDSPETYYDMIDQRIPDHAHDVAGDAQAANPDRRLARDGRGPAAADLHREYGRSDLLRDHPAQGQ